MVDLVVVEVVVMQDVAELTGVKGGAATDIAKRGAIVSIRSEKPLSLSC